MCLGMEGLTAPKLNGSRRTDQFSPAALYYSAKGSPGFKLARSLIERITLFICNLYHVMCGQESPVFVVPRFQASIHCSSRRTSDSVSRRMHVSTRDMKNANQTFDFRVVHGGLVTRVTEMFRKKISAIRDLVMNFGTPTYMPEIRSLRKCGTTAHFRLL